MTSFSKATYTYKWGKWHNGRPIGIADIMYAQAFIVRVDDQGRRWRQVLRRLLRGLRPADPGDLQGLRAEPDGTITTYFDFNHAGKDRIGAQGG